MYQLCTYVQKHMYNRSELLIYTLTQNKVVQLCFFLKFMSFFLTPNKVVQVRNVHPVEKHQRSNLCVCVCVCVCVFV
jgi:hypothetical protein